MVVDVAVGVVVCVVLGTEETIVVGGIVVAIVFVEVGEDIVDVLQDASNDDDTMRQVSAIQIIPLFIGSSCNSIRSS
jgi:hypothetical protein